MKFSADKVRMARVEARLKAKDVADHLGITAGYYSELENAKKPISLELAEKIADVLDKPLSFFETDVSASTPQEAMRQARLGRGLSFSDLAKITQIRPDALQRLESGDTKNSSERVIKAVCHALDLDPEDMMRTDDLVVREGVVGTFGATPAITLGPGIKRVKFVPLLSWAVAGTMQQVSDFTTEGYVTEGALAFDPKDPGAFAVRIVNDSMAPKYEAGDIAVVYPNFPPRNDRPVICRLIDDAGGDVLFKIYQTSDQGRRVVLSSYNPAFEPLTVDRDRFAWIFPVAAVTSLID